MPIHAFKDDKDGYYQVDIPDGEPLPEWTETMTPCDVALVSKTLSEELADLAVEYKADVATLQTTWLSAAVLGGSSEATKKAKVTSDLAERKTQYMADVAAVRAKYSH